MVKIKVKALTTNAYNGLRRHYNECTKLKNKIKLRSMGVRQNFLMNERALEINYSDILNKVQDKLTKINSKLSDFKAVIKEDQKQDFIKHVDSFMQEQKVQKGEYEVIFDDTTE